LGHLQGALHLTLLRECAWGEDWREKITVGASVKKFVHSPFIGEGIKQRILKIYGGLGFLAIV
jgi:hypothetical protein